MNYSFFTYKCQGCGKSILVVEEGHKFDGANICKECFEQIILKLKHLTMNTSGSRKINIYDD